MGGIADAIARFLLIGAEEHIMTHACLEVAGKEFLKRAKAAIGTYEYGWPALSPDTISRKQHGDTPLLETGAMRDSGGYEVQGDKVVIGFEDPKLKWHEYGTKHVPPRPVIGGTIDHHGQDIADAIGVSFAQIFGEALVIGSAATAARNVL